MPNTQSMKSFCQSCNNTTNHKILAHKSLDSRSIDPNEYHYGIEYYMLECLGCETVSFRKEDHDYEAYWQTAEDEYEHNISVDIYPHFIQNHKGLKSYWSLPDIVKDIYSQSLLAIQEEAYTLAGLGLRATIEAICNEQNINGKDLKIRINKMKTEGLISKKDASRLHAIRFMGNDAAHEIKKASKNSVLLALEIIEHLITSVYIFDTQTGTYLQTPIEDFESLLTVLKRHLKRFEATEIVTLKKWLDSDYRRIIDDSTKNTLEAELKTYIADGNLENVSLDNIRNADGTQIDGYKIIGSVK